jgi:hypothetical protein
MSETVSKKALIAFSLIIVAMLGSLAYGFFYAGVGKVDNCWDRYTTEEQAILNCEGENK